MWLRISLAVAALALAGAAAFAFDLLGSDEEEKVPKQPDALTSDQVEARAQLWRRDQGGAGVDTDCDVPKPKVELTRHDTWTTVGYELATRPRSPACRPYAVVGVLISGAPEEGRLTSIARTRVTGRSGTLILSHRPLRGHPPKRADVSALAVSGSSSPVVSVPLD